MKTKLIIVLLSIILLSNIIVNANNVTTKKDDELIENNFFNNDEEYIIITSNSFKNFNGENSFQALCDYHEEHSNLKTTIETVENIENTYPGMDIAEKIRNYIEYKSPEYVLLGGDDELIPGRLLQTDYDGDHYRPTPSDLYYSCPDTTWHIETTDLIPNSGDMSPGDMDIPSFSLVGEGFFQENGGYTDNGEMKWIYEDGSIDKYGYCKIVFDQPADLSEMNWLSFKLKTKLREYPRGPNGEIPQDILWWNCRVYIDDEKPVYFRPKIYADGVNAEEYEEFKLSIKLDPIYHNDYDKVNDICIRFYRSYDDDDLDEIDPYMDPGDHVLVDDLYFYDYDPYSLNKKSGNFKPTVCVGRMCVDNTNDIQNIVGKTLQYLKSTYSDDSFIENVLLVDTHGDETSQGRDKLDEIKNNYLDNSGYNSVKYYSNYRDASDVLFYEDNTNLLLYAGHGLSKGEYDEDGSAFINYRDIDKFKNVNPFFEYSTGCSVGAFDEGSCYAEHLTVKTNNAAFAGIWHTRTSWTSYYDGFNLFFKAVCDWDYTIGEAHRYQIQNSEGSGRFTHTLFGDPAVKLKKPTNLPEIPLTPEGETDLKANASYGYTTQSNDLDGERIKFGWDWDGDFVVDEWTIYYNKWVKISTVHSWDTAGIYEVRVKAMDEQGATSDWSDPLEVNVTKGKAKIKTIELPLVRLFLEKLSNFFPILKEMFI